MHVLVAAVAAALTLPSSASGAAVCHLVRDGAKDTTLASPLTAVSGSSVDIRSVDVATGAKTLVVVLRLGSSNVAADPAATLGLTWDVMFRIGNAGHRFGRRLGPGGVVLGDTATAAGKPIAGVKTKVAGNAVTWTVPRSAVPKLRGRGAVLTGFYASTWTPLLTYDQAPDSGSGGGSYTDRQRSCVKAA